MKLSNRILNQIHEFAHDEYINKAKRPEDSHETFRARCFVEAFLRVMSKEGNNVLIYDDDTNEYIPLSIE